MSETAATDGFEVDGVPADIARIVEHLREGGVLGYPTETVYGLGGKAEVEVVDAIRALKGRDEEKPLLLLLPGLERMRDVPSRWGLDLPHWAEEMVDRYWPGPLTLVLRDRDRIFPEGVRSGAGGVAVRVSPHPFVEALMQEWDAPLISTSANQSGEDPAVTAEGVRRALAGRPGGEGVMIVDGGAVRNGKPSSLVDCTGARPVLLREGSVSRGQLADILAEFRDDGR